MPEQAWFNEYYQPLANSFNAFLARNNNNKEAKLIVEAYKEEVNLYKKYKNYYGYGVYIATKVKE